MRQNGTSFSVGIAQSSLFSCVIFNQNASPRVVSEKIIDAHFLCAEDHLPYQGRQYSMKEFADLQGSLPRKIGQYNCKHMAVPILLGAPPAYSEETLEEMRKNSAEKIEIDGRTMSRYEWTQEQRRIETAVRYQKDRGVLAAHAGNMEIRRDAQGKINALMGRYEKISEKAGLRERRSRTYVEGFEHVKLKSLKNQDKSGMLIDDKQIGKKAGKHMAEWGLDPSKESDRNRFVEITNNIRDHADEVRHVPWKVDKETGKRTVKVKAYIKGNDVVLVDDSGKYITTMKDGINNKRVQGGEILK